MPTTPKKCPVSTKTLEADQARAGQKMTLAQFAQTHATDSDWLAHMRTTGRSPIVLNPGQRGTYSGFPATVLRHYCNSMYVIRVPGGETCVSATDFAPD
jgi:hypothetical protein